MRAFFVTNRGAVRAENQDALCVLAGVRTGDMEAPESVGVVDFPALFAVADGMGGYRGGALAARILSETLAQASRDGALLKGTDYRSESEALRETLESAAARMSGEAELDGRLCEMGAAVSGVIIREHDATIFNCGDCRVWRISCGGLERLSREHSIVEELVARGAITEDEMRTHRQKNVLTSAVSADPGTRLELYARRVSRVPEDSYFLCSDGVWETLDPDETENFLSRPRCDAPLRLFEAIMRKKCRDNVSFIWLFDDITHF